MYDFHNVANFNCIAATELTYYYPVLTAWVI